MCVRACVSDDVAQGKQKKFDVANVLRVGSECAWCALEEMGRNTRALASAPHTLKAHMLRPAAVLIELAAHQSMQIIASVDPERRATRFVAFRPAHT